jgi:hypothetical protein
MGLFSKRQGDDAMSSCVPASLWQALRDGGRFARLCAVAGLHARRWPVCRASA